MQKLPSFSFKIFILIALLAFNSCKLTEKNSREIEQQPAQVSDEPVVDELPVEKGEYRAENTKYHDLIHTKLQVSFDWAKKHVYGTVTLELKPYFYPQKQLVLDAKGFDIHEIYIPSAEGNTPLKYQYNNEQLVIELEREYSREEKFFVEIKYTAKPDERKTSGSEAIQSDKGLYFINPTGEDPDKPRQIWTQGETEASSAWFPTIDSPNQKTTQEMYITVDKKFKTLSNGLLIYSQNNEDGTRTDYWKMDLPHAPYLFMIAIGEFAVIKDQWKDIEVDYYVEPSYAPYAKAIFGNTPEMLTFFSEKLDYPFPWQKYAQVVVRDFVSGAMENTTASVFMEDVQVDDKDLLDESWDGIIAHELFHQWFGNLVTTESWSNLPLNESFANYSEYLWAEHKLGVDEADYLAMEEMDKYFSEAATKQVDLIRFHYDDKEEMFDSHSYAKGGRILHMLRNYLGDEAFFKSLSVYLKENEFSTAEVHNLRLAFEKVSGMDLNWFFNQWFLASGHPVVKVSHAFDQGKLIVNVKQEQNLQTTPLYKLPVNIEVWVNGKVKRYPVEVNGEEEIFSFEVNEKPDLVLFDSDMQLLAEIEHEKSKEELRFQMKNAKKFAAKYVAMLALAEDLQNEETRKLMEDALNDPFWVLRQTAVGAFESYEGADVLEVEKKLSEMALNDPKSLVRADALSVLFSISANANKQIFIKALEDPSYAVKGAALYNYLQIPDAEGKEEVLEKYENLDKPSVYLPIANYYAQLGTTEKYDWFANKVKESSGANLYYILNFFGRFLFMAPEEVKLKGAEIMEDYALNNQVYYIRMAAYQGLVLLSEVEQINSMRLNVKNKETDPRLVKIYANME